MGHHLAYEPGRWSPAVSDLETPGSPSEQPPAAYAPPARRPVGLHQGCTPAPTGQVPERLGGPYYSPGLVILLSIVTLGIWTFLWVYRTNEDLKRYNGDGLGGVLGVVHPPPARRRPDVHDPQ